MNLPLHFGILGSFEAGAIALLIGFLVYCVSHWVAWRADRHHSYAIGWSVVIALAIGAGIDSWHLFYLGVVDLESTLYARMALEKIHDPEFLGTRVLLEAIGAVCGVLIGRLAFSVRSSAEAGAQGPIGAEDQP